MAAPSHCCHAHVMDDGDSVVASFRAEVFRPTVNAFMGVALRIHEHHVCKQQSFEIPRGGFSMETSSLRIVDSMDDTCQSTQAKPVAVTSSVLTDSTVDWLAFHE